MTIYQLLDWYSRQVEAYGKDQANENLYNLGYNRTLSMLIPQLFDDRGAVVQLSTSHC